MAQPWEQDWSKPAAGKADDESTPPWERKWGNTHAAPPKAQDGQAVSGFKRSFQEVPGMLAGVGAYAADVVGADGVKKSFNPDQGKEAYEYAVQSLLKSGAG